MTTNTVPKPARRIKVGTIGAAILTCIAVGGIVTVAALFPGITMVIAPFVKKKKYSPKQAVERNLDSLIRSGLVHQYVDAQGKLVLKLTKKGKWEAMLRHPKQDRKQKQWDGIWRVVVFDIPKKKDAYRAHLRRAMSLFGFKMLQQSVWVYPYPCDDFVSVLKDHLGVTHDVLYMQVKYIENDSYLRKEFKL